MKPEMIFDIRIKKEGVFGGIFACVSIHNNDTLVCSMSVKRDVGEWRTLKWDCNFRKVIDRFECLEDLIYHIKEEYNKSNLPQHGFLPYEEYDNITFSCKAYCGNNCYHLTSLRQDGMKKIKYLWSKKAKFGKTKEKGSRYYESIGERTCGKCLLVHSDYKYRFEFNSKITKYFGGSGDELKDDYNIILLRKIETEFTKEDFENCFKVKA